MFPLRLLVAPLLCCHQDGALSHWKFNEWHMLWAQSTHRAHVFVFQETQEEKRKKTK